MSCQWVVIDVGCKSLGASITGATGRQWPRSSTVTSAVSPPLLSVSVALSLPMATGRYTTLTVVMVSKPSTLMSLASTVNTSLSLCVIVMGLVNRLPLTSKVRVSMLAYGVSKTSESVEYRMPGTSLRI